MPRGSGHQPRLPGRRSGGGDATRMPDTGAPIDIGLSLSVSALDRHAGEPLSSQRPAPWPTEH